MGRISASIVLVCCMGAPLLAQNQDSDLLQTLDRVIQQNDQLQKQNQELMEKQNQLQKQNRELMDQIQPLREALAARTGDLREASQSQQTTPPATSQPP
jgi:uncharacterized coiled-coil DUF342 family protein